MKQLDAVQKAVQWLFSPIAFLYGNIHDCYGEDDENLIGRLRSLLQENYDVSYYDASIVSPNNNDNSQDEAQKKYRPVDEACCNIQSVIADLVDQCERKKCIIINLSYIRSDNSRESFLRQLPKVLESGIGHNRIIVIGDEADLPMIQSAEGGIRGVKLGLPSSEYMREYLAEKISSRLSSEQVETLIRYCRERYQMEARDVVNFLKQSKFTKESFLNATQILKEDCKEDATMDVTLDDVIGLDEAKEVIRRRVELPRDHKDLFSDLFHAKPCKALLLYGPPGTGKTMFANAIANKLCAVFYNMSLSSILDQYQGNSEKHVRDVFVSARRQESAVVFLDEIDAIACKRSEDSPNMTRVKTELLTQIQASSDRVLIIGATNRPSEIDPAFVRNGRFGLQIAVGLPGKDQRIEILKRKLKGCEDSDIDFEQIAKETYGWNCADIQALHEEAAINAVERYMRDGILDDENGSKVIAMKDYIMALKEIESTVTEEDLKEYMPGD